MMLTVSDLNFDYSDRRLLHGINFSLAKGELLHLRGKNGSGKTTLLKLLTGLLRPCQGEIVFAGHSIYEDIATYQRNICYVGHKSGVSQLLTVRENCRFELSASTSICAFDELIRSFFLDGMEDMPCGLLSMGQRRRVGLLRILLSNASLWVLDEPLVGLDEPTLNVLMDCLTQHLVQGGQVVLTSHQALPEPLPHYREYWL